MFFLYTVLKTYPYWAVPLAFISWEVAIFYRRRAKKAQYPFWVALAFFGITTLIWGIFHRDIYSDKFVKPISSQNHR